MSSEIFSYIERAQVVLVTSGAGMSVGSGLGTFRGVNAGAWEGMAAFNANGPDGRRRVHSFCDVTTPLFLEQHPDWGFAFWKWRHDLYAATEPHEGYFALHRMLKGKEARYITSNIDGLWSKLGVDVWEMHGSVMRNQCSQGCGAPVWDAADDYARLQVDGFRARPETFPRCPGCNALARPNIRMFSDYGFDHSVVDATRVEHQGADLVIEIGCGKGVPTLRLMGEQLVEETGATLIRISLEDASVDARALRGSPKVVLLKGEANEFLLQ